MVKKRYKVILENLKCTYPVITDEDALFRAYLGDDYLSTSEKKAG